MSAWQDALLAARLLADDPHALGGIALRARAGPVRERWLGCFVRMLRPGVSVRRLPFGIADERLLGGLDLTATMAAGRPVLARGLLAECDGGVLVAAMAERMPSHLAARLAAVLDTGRVTLERDGFAHTWPARVCLVLFDEGVDADERAPGALQDRVAMHVDLTGVSMREAAAELALPAEDGAAVTRAECIDAFCAASLSLGIDSARAPLFALRVARALAGDRALRASHAAAAGRLVLAPRANAMPAAEPPPPPADETPPAAGEVRARPLEDVVTDAARAVLPTDVLAALHPASERRAASSAGRGGDWRPSRGRGRPAGTVAGDPRTGVRLDLIATLRAAAPWQRLRVRPNDLRVAVRRGDFRVTRFVERARTTAIFAVDASGSQALHRLAEAKGAVALVLADCYVRRDSVALIAFRGARAQTLLPPTRSLARARRSLAGLPGGGGTPLASGIDAAVALAASVRRRGETPLVVLLTDGQANVARDGTGGREAAHRDALAAASALRRERVACLVIDSSPQPRPAAREIAQAADARYLPLPHAAPAGISEAVKAAR